MTEGLDRSAPIFVAGHRGLVGSALVRCLEKAGFSNILTRSRDELDLTDQLAVRDFFTTESPTYVFLAAAKVGGIQANDRYPAEFLNQNLAIQNNVISSAYEEGVRKLLFLGSSCIYPKMAEQPIREDSLLTGPLEPTNEAYAIAKIAGLKMCQAYHRQYGFKALSVMPTNLYGPGDNFDLENSHVIPALMRKAHEAKQLGLPEMQVWGSGAPRREFLHVDDLARACLFLMDRYEGAEPVNVGAGSDLTIRELAELIAKTVGFQGELAWQTDKPDGTPRKLLDISRIREMGWSAEISLKQGLAETYRWFQAQAD